MITCLSLERMRLLRAEVRAAAALKRAISNERRNLARQRAVERDVAGRSQQLPPALWRRDLASQFAVPAKRKAEYLSASGMRTFHFAFSSVTKSNAQRGKAGTRVYKGAATKHVEYIEDGARELNGHTAYIDSGRVENGEDGERLVLSNICDTPEGRQEFFHLVEQFERQNRGDVVQIDFGLNPELWNRVVQHPDCDHAVSEAYKSRYEHRRPRLALQGPGSKLRTVMKAHGFSFDKPVAKTERLKRDGFCFQDGRGGRTQYRLVFELPREFNLAQRKEALEELARLMEGHGCMYVAVIHAPDPHNDADNYHIHLDFYDRECRQLTGTDDDLKNVKP